MPTVHADEAGSPQSGKRAKTEIESDFRFDGVWKPKAAIMKGVFLPPPAIEGIQLTINGERYEVSAKGEDHSDIGTYSVDATTTP